MSNEVRAWCQKCRALIPEACHCATESYIEAMSADKPLTATEVKRRVKSIAEIAGEVERLDVSTIQIVEGVTLGDVLDSDAFEFALLGRVDTAKLARQLADDPTYVNGNRFSS